MVVAGRFAYVADIFSGLAVVDIGDPASPRWVAGLELPYKANGVAVAGGCAWVSDWSAGKLVPAIIPERGSPLRTGDRTLFVNCEEPT